MKRIILSIFLLFVSLLLVNSVSALPGCWCENGEAVCWPGCNTIPGQCDCSLPNPLCAWTCGPTEYCGDGEIVQQIGEKCDYSEDYPPYPALYFLPGQESCQDLNYPGGNLECYRSGHPQECKLNVTGCYWCGNGQVENDPGVYTEACDDGSANGQCINGFQCKNNCQLSEPCNVGSSCGNGICETELGEGSTNCFQDCGYNGWTSTGEWIIEEGSLRGLEKNIMAYSPPMNLKAEESYTLFANIYNNYPSYTGTNCKAFVDLGYQGECLDPNTWEYVNGCFPSVTIEAQMSTWNTANWVPKSYTFTLPNGPLTDDGFYNGVKIRAVVWCGDGQSGAIPNAYGIYFDNIYLKTNKLSSVYYDWLPLDTSSSNACCPNNWCWDGTACVDSDFWMNDSQEEPIFNNIFNNNAPNPWRNYHVNRSAQPNSQGYRCVNAYGTNIADWQPAKVKYDWDGEQSGYCNNPNNCFVGIDYNVPSAPASGQPADSCITNGTYMDENYVLQQGNHYCWEGEWTTRTFLAASYLSAWAENAVPFRPYILSCGDPSQVFNNDSLSEILVSACAMIIQRSASDEDIYLALIPIRNDYMENAYIGVVSDFNLAEISPEDEISTAFVLNDCGSTDSGWLVCWDGENNIPSRPISLYVHQEYGLMVVSDESISYMHALTPLENLWNNIVNFFRRLFGLQQVQQHYRVFNATSNYETLYVMKNNTQNVRGIEEQKYDEIKYAVVSYLYLNYTPNSSDYILDQAYINKKYPSSQGYNVSFNPTANSYGTDELIIISNNNAQIDIWPYITSRLRNRR